MSVAVFDQDAQREPTTWSKRALALRYALRFLADHEQKAANPNAHAEAIEQLEAML